MLARIIESHITVTATFNVEDKYEIVPDSVVVSHGVHNLDEDDVEVDVNHDEGKITVILSDEAPEGKYTIKYKIREKQPLVGENLAATGELRIQDEKHNFPEIKLNSEEALCNLTIQKVDDKGQPLAGASFKVVGPDVNGKVWHNGPTDGDGKVELTNVPEGI